MEVRTFLITFEKSLCELGFQRETAHSHTLKIAKSLSPSDRARIDRTAAPGEVAEIAANYAKRVFANGNAAPRAEVSNIRGSASQSAPHGTRQDAAVQSAPKPRTAPPATKTIPSSMESTRTVSVNFNSALSADETENARTAQTTTVQRITKKPSPQNSDLSVTKKINNVDIRALSKVKLTDSGKKEYTKRILTHLWAIIPAALGAFILVFTVYAAISAVIAAVMLLLAAIIVAGSAAGLAGFVYGIIKLFSVLPEGIYEIGLAIVILGITLALSICSYNLAVRYIPLLWRKFTDYLKHLRIRLNIYKNKIRTECNER